eukprot:4822705-Prymnesium_polylepis.1
MANAQPSDGLPNMAGDGVRARAQAAAGCQWLPLQVWDGGRGDGARGGFRGLVSAPYWGLIAILGFDCHIG